MTLKNKKQKTRHKGNKKAQQKRRRERQKNLPQKQNALYELIDGNWSHYPVGICMNHNGCYLTQGLMDTHRCIERQCSGFRELKHEEEILSST